MKYKCSRFQILVDFRYVFVDEVHYYYYIHAMYEKTGPRMIILPLLKCLLIIYTALERGTKTLFPSELGVITDPAFVRLVTSTFESSLAVGFHDGLDMVIRELIWVMLLSNFPRHSTPSCTHLSLSEIQWLH